MKKGFTLVELLAVIAILGIVMLIGTISVIGILNSSAEKNLANEGQKLTEAAKLYLDGEGKNKSCITLKELVDSGYYSDNKSGYNGVVKVITSTNKTFKYFISNKDLAIKGQRNKEEYTVVSKTAVNTNNCSGL